MKTLETMETMETMESQNRYIRLKYTASLVSKLTNNIIHRCPKPEAKDHIVRALDDIYINLDKLINLE